MNLVKQFPRLFICAGAWVWCSHSSHHSGDPWYGSDGGAVAGGHRPTAPIRDHTQICKEDKRELVMDPFPLWCNWGKEALIRVCSHGNPNKLISKGKPTDIWEGWILTCLFLQTYHPHELGLEVGQTISVKYLGKNPVTGRHRVSRKALLPAPEAVTQRQVATPPSQSNSSEQNAMSPPGRYTPPNGSKLASEQQHVPVKDTRLTLKQRVPEMDVGQPSGRQCVPEKRKAYKRTPQAPSVLYRKKLWQDDVTSENETLMARFEALLSKKPEPIVSM